MKIRARRRFKEDFKRLEKKLKRSAALRRALYRAINQLQLGCDLSEDYTVNRIPAEGAGWFAVYFYKNYVLICKIEGQYVKLSRLGTAKELEKEQ